MKEIYFEDGELLTEFMTPTRVDGAFEQLIEEYEGLADENHSLAKHSKYFTQYPASSIIYILLLQGTKKFKKDTATNITKSKEWLGVYVSFRKIIKYFIEVGILPDTGNWKADDLDSVLKNFEPLVKRITPSQLNDFGNKIYEDTLLQDEEDVKIYGLMFRLDIIQGLKEIDETLE